MLTTRGNNTPVIFRIGRIYISTTRQVLSDHHVVLTHEMTVFGDDIFLQNLLCYDVLGAQTAIMEQ
jgi:hypothetical protein